MTWSLLALKSVLMLCSVGTYGVLASRLSPEWTHLPVPYRQHRAFPRKGGRQPAQPCLGGESLQRSSVMPSDCLRRNRAAQGSACLVPALSFGPAASPKMASGPARWALASGPLHTRRGPARLSQRLNLGSLPLDLFSPAENLRAPPPSLKPLAFRRPIRHYLLFGGLSCSSRLSSEPAHDLARLRLEALRAEPLPVRATRRMQRRRAAEMCPPSHVPRALARLWGDVGRRDTPAWALRKGWRKG